MCQVTMSQVRSAHQQGLDEFRRIVGLGHSHRVTVGLLDDYFGGNVTDSFFDADGEPLDVTEDLFLPWLAWCIAEGERAAYECAYNL